MKIRASLLTTVLLLSALAPVEAQVARRAPNKTEPTVPESKGNGPLAWIFSRKKEAPVEPPPTNSARNGEDRSRTGGGSSSLAATPVLAGGELTPVPRRSPRQKRIFVLGDSQGHTEFGPEFQKQLLLGGHEVLFHSVKNGTPYYWSGMWDSPVLTRIYTPAAEPEEAGAWDQVSMKPRTIDQYVEAFDPDVFIFQAGTNFELDLAGDSPRQISSLVTQCVSQATARGARVLWIGPPDARDDVKSSAFQERAAATLKAALAPFSEQQGAECFFDSRAVCPMSNSANGDGEHPGPTAARNWARAAAGWSLESITQFGRDRDFRGRKPAPIRAVPVPPLLAAMDQPATAVHAYPMKLRLVAKSRIEDPKTMVYTDAFSVYKYELQNPGEVLGKLKGLTLTTAGPKAYQVYVLHWTAHNDGRQSATTRMASLKEGSTVKMELTPLEEHPLRKALATMRQFNDFDDFEAPIFVASTFLDERKF